MNVNEASVPQGKARAASSARAEVPPALWICNSTQLWSGRKDLKIHTYVHICIPGGKNHSLHSHLSPGLDTSCNKPSQSVYCSCYVKMCSVMCWRMVMETRSHHIWKLELMNSEMLWRYEALMSAYVVPINCNCLLIESYFKTCHYSEHNLCAPLCPHHKWHWCKEISGKSAKKRTRSQIPDSVLPFWQVQ